MKVMWDITNFKLTLGSMLSLSTILLGKIFAQIHLPTLSTLTSIAGLILAAITSVHYIVQIRKNWRETPPSKRTLKRIFKNYKK